MGPRLRNATLKVDKLSDHQVGYIAAFLGGEGDVKATRTTQEKANTLLAFIRVCFAKTNKEVIEAIRNWPSAGCVIKPKAKAKDTAYLRLARNRNEEHHRITQLSQAVHDNRKEPGLKSCSNIATAGSMATEAMRGDTVKKN